MEVLLPNGFLDYLWAKQWYEAMVRYAICVPLDGAIWGGVGVDRRGCSEADRHTWRSHQGEWSYREENNVSFPATLPANLQTRGRHMRAFVYWGLTHSGEIFVSLRLPPPTPFSIHSSVAVSISLSLSPRVCLFISVCLFHSPSPSLSVCLSLSAYLSVRQMLTWYALHSR